MIPLGRTRLNEEETRVFDRVYRQHAPDVFRICLKLALGDRAWAADRCHDVFMTLAQNLSTLREPEALGGWLYRVAVNACYKEMRRRRVWTRVFERLREAPAPRQPHGDKDVQAKRDLTTVEQAIRALPPKECALVVLVSLEGKSQAEAGQLLGLSPGYVSKLHQRALVTLRAQDWELAYGK